MAYQTYTTEALVLSSRDRMGADRMVRLFTESAGMVDARAQSIREERSKMRYALQPLSFVRVTLVRGKREWRITGVEPRSNLFLSAADRACRASIVRIARTLERLVRGEEEARSLFSIIADGLSHVSRRGDEDASRILELRALTALGYVAVPVSLMPLVDASTLTDALMHMTPEQRTEVDALLAEALEVSHL